MSYPFTSIRQAKSEKQNHNVASGDVKKRAVSYVARGNGNF